MAEQLTLNQIIERIEMLKGMEDRWPARLIFTHTLNGYIDLVAKLRTVCDESVSISDECFTTAEDILPNFKKLASFISERESKTILITDISEYLRICIKKETTADGGFKGIWERVGAVTSKTKIIIPLFSCDSLFDRIIPTINERQASNVWKLAEPQASIEVSLSMYSLDFSKSLPADVIGLRTWLSSWDDLWTKKASCSLVSKLIKYAEEQRGDVSLRIVDDPFSYVTEIVSDGGRLKKEWFTDWSLIAGKLSKGESFADFIMRELGINDFNFHVIASRWASLSETERRYVWIWYRLYPNDSYVNYIITHSEKTNDIPQNFRDKILEISSPSIAWINERRKILGLFPSIKIDDAFLARLGKLPIEKQVELLNFTSPSEQAYALELIGKMLANGAELTEALAPFGERFPHANDYFAEIVTDGELSSYFRWYKSNKLKNRSVDFDALYIDIDSYDSRHKVLTKHDNIDTYFLWVDGLGLEWSALLCRLIEKKEIPANVTLKIGKALLPTETDFNKVWSNYTAPYDKLNRFDKMAHSGVPDNKSYYACIAEQFAIIGEIADEAVRLIEMNNNLVIVGDHGSSRLAALAFHAYAGLKPAKDWDVKSHGRFCILPRELSFEEIPPDFEPVSRQLDGETVYTLVSKSYAHLSQSGNAPFETHGGATPEEALVTILILSRHTPLPKPTIDTSKKRGFSTNEMRI